MNIGFYLSSLGGSPLQSGLERGLIELGHNVKYGTDDCDLVLVFNQCAHDPSYVYPDAKITAPIVFIDAAEYGPKGRENHTKYHHAFSRGSMTHDTKSEVQQRKLYDMLQGRSFPYLLREMWVDQEYPDCYHPIDYPLYHLSSRTKLDTLDEYIKRTTRVACIWGLSNPDRVSMTEVARKARKSDVYVIEQDGPRLPQAEYFRRLENARCTISADGYGSGSFRMTEALVRTALLMSPLKIKTRAPLVDGETMRDFWNTNELKAEIIFMNEYPEGAYETYRNGFDHCHTYYTEKATAQYVLDVVASHDWSKPTWI